MKKIFKLLIALVVIAGIAIGVYFIFGRKTNNAEIYNKINHFNTQIVADNTNVVEKVDQTILEMIGLINAEGFDLEAEQKFLTTYINSVDAYSVVKSIVLTNGLFVNEADNTKVINNLTKASENLEKIYVNGYNYLKADYFEATSSAKKAYIQNFYNVFKGALNELNVMYRNAGIAIIGATNNSLTFSTAQKLKLNHYITAISMYVNEYLTNAETPVVTIEFINSLNEKLFVTAETYVENKQIFDNLFNAGINVEDIIKQQIAGTLSTYVEGITNENEKLNVQNYCTYVVEG